MKLAFRQNLNRENSWQEAAATAVLHRFEPFDLDGLPCHHNL